MFCRSVDFVALANEVLLSWAAFGVAVVCVGVFVIIVGTKGCTSGERELLILLLIAEEVDDAAEGIDLMYNGSFSIGVASVSVGNNAVGTLNVNAVDVGTDTLEVISFVYIISIAFVWIADFVDGVSRKTNFGS